MHDKTEKNLALLALASLSDQLKDVEPCTPPDEPDDVGPGAISAVPDIKGLPHDDAIDAIAQWFFANFEDPVHSTPWNDGAYVYVRGGPYDAHEELSYAFGPAISASLIEAAAEHIEADGYEWVRRRNRLVDERL